MQSGLKKVGGREGRKSSVRRDGFKSMEEEEEEEEAFER